MSNDSQPTQPTRRVLVLNFGPPGREPNPPVPTDARVVVYKNQGVTCPECINYGLLQNQISISENTSPAEPDRVPHAAVYEFDCQEMAEAWVESVKRSFHVVTYVDNATRT